MDFGKLRRNQPCGQNLRIQPPSNDSWGRPSFDCLGIDPVKRSQIEEQLRKQELMEKVKLELENQKEKRRTKLEEQAQKRVQEKQKYLERIQNQLEEFEQGIIDGEAKQKQKELDLEAQKLDRMEKIKENCQNQLKIFEEKAEKKRQQLEAKLEYQRKILLKLNQETLREAQKRLMSQSFVQTKSKEKSNEDNQNKRKHLNSLIDRIRSEIEEAEACKDSATINQLLQQQEKRQLEKRMAMLQTRPKSKIKQNIMHKNDFQSKNLMIEKKSLNYASYDEEYLKSKLNVEKVLRDHQNLMDIYRKPMDKSNYNDSIASLYLRQSYGPRYRSPY